MFNVLLAVDRSSTDPLLALIWTIVTETQYLMLHVPRDSANKLAVLYYAV